MYREIGIPKDVEMAERLLASSRQRRAETGPSPIDWYPVPTMSA